MNDIIVDSEHLFGTAQVSDAFALCFAGQLQPEIMLRMASAAAAAPAAQSAAGSFLLLNPVIDGIQQLQVSFFLLLFCSSGFLAKPLKNAKICKTDPVSQRHPAWIRIARCSILMQ